MALDSSLCVFYCGKSVAKWGSKNVGFEVEEEEWKIDHGGDCGGGLNIIMTKAKANW